METNGSESMETIFGRIFRKLDSTTTYDFNKTATTYPTNGAESFVRTVSKPQDGEYIDSPIISFQLGTVCKERPSIISLRIQGKSGTSEDDKNSSFLRRNAGILFALAATLSFSLASLILKMFNEHHEFHAFSVSIWRCQALILPQIPSLAYHLFYEKEAVLRGIWPLARLDTFKNIFYITMRSLVGTAATILQVYALQYLTMADASVIFCSTPVFVLFVARIFLGEKAGYFAVVIALFTLAGVVIIARPPILTGVPIDSDMMLGIIFAVATMLTTSLVFVVLRRLKDVHYTVISVGYGIQGTVASLILAVYFDVLEFPGTMMEWVLFFGLIIFSWCGQIGLVLALQLEQCAIVSLLNSLDTCYAFILQFIFFGVIPDVYSIAGAAVVLTGVLLTTFRKYLATQPEENLLRKRFRLLLK